LLKLQSEARRADVQRRLREQYGDRDFVNRITRYNISSFLDWGVVAELKRTGVYVSGTKIQSKNTEQLAWLAEAVLISRGKNQMKLSQIFYHPILFPLTLDTSHRLVLPSNSSLKLARQGLNEEIVFIERGSEVT
jgi:hypothetical protein